MDSENTPKCYTLRIKVQPDIPCTTEILKRWLREYGATQWVYAFEDNTNKTNAHYHVVYLTNQKTTLVDHIKQIHPHFKGNKYFSHTPAKDIDLAIRYTLKDGEFEFEGFSENYIQEQLKLSYKKTGDGNMSKEIDKIREQYITTGMSIRQGVAMYVNLLIKYNKTINRNHMKSLILSWELQRSVESRNRYIDLLVRDVKFDLTDDAQEIFTSNYFQN